MQRILITGCAKTRTTLVQRLFLAFKDTIVIPGESTAECLFGNDVSVPGNIVIKRVAGEVLSVPYNYPKDRLRYLRKHRVKIVFVTRNRSSTLSSSNGYVKPDRYDGVLRDYNNHSNLVDLCINTGRPSCNSR